MILNNQAKTTGQVGFSNLGILVFSSLGLLQCSSHLPSAIEPNNVPNPHTINNVPNIVFPPFSIRAE